MSRTTIKCQNAFHTETRIKIMRSIATQFRALTFLSYMSCFFQTMSGKFPGLPQPQQAAAPNSNLAPLLRPPPSNYLNNGGQHALLDDFYLIESAGRPPPPPPAPPSTPVIKQAASQKYHYQLLQQLPKRLANGIKARPEDYMWLDPSGRPTSPPRTMSPQNKAQCTRKVGFLLFLGLC